MVTMTRQSRQMLVRVVEYLAGEAGIRQFLDIGSGLPTANNTHEVAQRIAPESRVVYVDNDPLVLTHARALLHGDAQYVDADARDTAGILETARQTLDSEQPIAVLLLGVLNFIGDDGEAYGIVGRLMEAVPPGSYLA